MYCVYCGHKMKDDDIFCGSCGMKQAIEKKEVIEKTKTVVVYRKEEPIKPIVSNLMVVLLTFGIILLSILMIFGISSITENYENISIIENIKE